MKYTGINQAPIPTAPNTQLAKFAPTRPTQFWETGRVLFRLSWPTSYDSRAAALKIPNATRKSPSTGRAFPRTLVEFARVLGSCFFLRVLLVATFLVYNPLGNCLSSSKGEYDTCFFEMFNQNPITNLKIYPIDSPILSFLTDYRTIFLVIP